MSEAAFWFLWVAVVLLLASGPWRICPTPKCWGIAPAGRWRCPRCSPTPTTDRSEP